MIRPVRLPRSVWLLVPGAAAGALYLATLAPSLLWGDSAGFQLRAYRGELHSGTLGHPLWVLLAHRFVRWLPGADPAWKANLLSAAAGALAVLFVAVIIYQISGSLSGAVLGAGVLAISHTFWLHAVIAEVYTLHLCFVAAAAWLIGLEGRASGRWTDLLAWLLLGLSVSVHLLTLPLLPAFLYFTFARRRAGRIAASLVAGMLGLLPFIYWELTAPSKRELGNSLAILTAPLSPAFWTASPRYLGLGLAYGGYQFLLSAPVGLWGLRVMWRWHRRWAWFWLLWLLGSLGFAFTHRVPDQFVFYLPAWLAFAVCCGVGYGDLLGRMWAARRWQPLLLAALIAWGAPVVAYRLAAEAVPRAGSGLPLRPIPYRDAARFFFWPPKGGEAGARQYVDQVFSALPPGSLLVADWTLYAPLVYAQEVEGRRPDVELLGDPFVPGPDYLLGQPPARALYLADANRYYPLAALEQGFELRQEGVLYALKRAGSP
ncbi:MAG: protein O-mannosyl-transferase family [Anaerolineae bacterium]